MGTVTRRALTVLVTFLLGATVITAGAVPAQPTSAAEVRRARSTAA
jgi:hypothetical protein